ncbi:hypothetical protein IWW50_004672 [Coemansia erecta]|nr:hypothetical protein GGF43_000749 [Coemansia sp. RSA 2618]KAJ2821351.1 hypothetical protein IWW50_004672 [Coemansia erecta]
MTNAEEVTRVPSGLLNKPKVFDGMANITHWLARMHDFVTMMQPNATDAQLIGTLMTYLDGPAYMFVHELRGEGAKINMTTNEFSEKLKAEFTTHDDQYMAERELVNLVHSPGKYKLAHYQTELRELFQRIPDVSAAEKHRWFLAGLDEKLCTEVDTQVPKTYEDAITVAIRCNTTYATGISIKGTAHKPAQTQRDPNAMDIDAFEQRKVQWSDEQVDQYKRGLCFCCSKKGHRSHDCLDRPKRTGRLNRMMINNVEMNDSRTDSEKGF